MTSTALTASVASMTSTASFCQKNCWSSSFDHAWHPNDQYWSRYVEGITKKPKFSLISERFLSEAVEASWCYFFENWRMNLKYTNLLKPLSTIVHYNYQSLYLSEPSYFALFNVRHPVDIQEVPAFHDFGFQRVIKKCGDHKFLRLFFV